MNDKFTKCLTEFLDIECSDFDMDYSWEWNEDTERCEVGIKRNPYESYVSFKYNEKKDILIIELCEDCWYEIKKYDYTVRYFWMVIAPDLFPN